MSARDFALPADLESLLQQVCAEREVPVRRHDELRSLLLTPRQRWPACCLGQCKPCIDDQTRIAGEVLSRCERAPVTTPPDHE